MGTIDSFKHLSQFGGIGSRSSQRSDLSVARMFLVKLVKVDVTIASHCHRLIFIKAGFHMEGKGNAGNSSGDRG
jgi:hypothetical protein